MLIWNSLPAEIHRSDVINKTCLKNGAASYFS